MRLLALLILLGFPLLDLYLTIQLASFIRVPTPILLLAGLLAGVFVLRNERLAFRARTIAALNNHSPLIRNLLDSGRKILAGVFFILPGVISDCLAVLLLLLPINLGHSLRPGPAAADVIEGNFRRLD